MPAKRQPAGKRDRLVTLRKLIPGVDEAYAPTQVPSGTSYQMWAHREDVVPSPQYREHFSADRVVARAETVWTMPWRAELDPERVDVAKDFDLVHGGRVYDITHAAMIGRRDAIALNTIAQAG